MTNLGKTWQNSFLGQFLPLLAFSSPGPSIGLDLCLEHNEYQTAIRWWLELNTSGRSTCTFCPDPALDPLGHRGLQALGRWGHTPQSLVDESLTSVLMST